MDGYQVTTLEDVLGTADIFVTATTGNRDVITAGHMSQMKHQAIVGNIGPLRQARSTWPGCAKWPGIRHT